MIQPGLGALLTLLVPLILAIVVISTERLTAPDLAERHARKRRPGVGWDRFEIVAGIVVAIAVLGMMIFIFVSLWISKSPY